MNPRTVYSLLAMLIIVSFLLVLSGDIHNSAVEHFEVSGTEAFFTESYMAATVNIYSQTDEFGKLDQEYVESDESAETGNAGEVTGESGMLELRDSDGHSICRFSQNPVIQSKRLGFELLDRDSAYFPHRTCDWIRLSMTSVYIIPGVEDYAFFSMEVGSR